MTAAALCEQKLFTADIVRKMRVYSFEHATHCTAWKFCNSMNAQTLRQDKRCDTYRSTAPQCAEVPCPSCLGSMRAQDKVLCGGYRKILVKAMEMCHEDAAKGQKKVLCFGVLHLNGHFPHLHRDCHIIFQNKFTLTDSSYLEFYGKSSLVKLSGQAMLCWQQVVSILQHFKTSPNRL